MVQGKFIALDGPDGGGKGTQVKYLDKAFALTGLSYITTKEAGGTELGQHIRKLILDSSLAARDGEMDALTSAYLFMADRRHNVIHTILPALNSEKHVIADRYGLATAMYQGYGLGEDVDAIYTMLKQATVVWPSNSPLMADLYLILDVPAEVGLQRKHVQQGHQIDRLEGKGADLQRKVREGYLTFMKHPDFVDKAVLIDATADPMTVHRNIVDTINSRLGLGIKPLESLEM